MTGRPVSDADNAHAHGMALCSDHVFEDFVRKAERLRRRQDDYLAGLPVEPAAAIKAARRVLQPCGDSYPDGLKEALRLSNALPAMMEREFGECRDPDADAMMWIAYRVTMCLEKSTRQIDLIVDILANPARIESEAGEAAQTSATVTEAAE